ncbi:MAG: hypothetical protein ABW185_04530 [Sedimenticola sp.]
MKLYISPKQQLEIIKPIWRILLAAFVVQLAGGIVGIVNSKYNLPFIDFWYGGAISTFPGFIIGALWHQLSSADEISDNKLAFLFIGAICLCLTVSALFMPLEQMASTIRVHS